MRGYNALKRNLSNVNLLVLRESEITSIFLSVSAGRFCSSESRIAIKVGIVMATLSIQLFGKFCVRRNEQVLDGFEARKVQELFCYLLLHRDHALPRETLASILWPNTTTLLSKKSLRQALWQLQSALAPQSETSHERILLVEPEWIQLNPEADLWLDVAVLEHTFDLVQKVP